MLERRREYVGFLVVGGIGFLVDAGILSWLVMVLDWGPYGARLVSFGGAVSVTWYLNRTYTFQQQRVLPRTSEYARYFTVQGMGALINLAVFAAATLTFPQLGAYPVLPLALASGVAMVFNFLGAKFFAFAPQKPFSPKV